MNRQCLVHAIQQEGCKWENVLSARDERILRMFQAADVGYAQISEENRELNRRMNENVQRDESQGGVSQRVDRIDIKGLQTDIERLENEMKRDITQRLRNDA